MSNRYVVVLGAGSILPDREILIGQAWGDVPVSYVQDHEVFNECSFLDLKVNKWEINSQWRSKQESEPWIRIEILKGQVLEEYLRNEGCPLSVEVARETLIIFGLDEGGGQWTTCCYCVWCQFFMAASGSTHGLSALKK